MPRNLNKYFSLPLQTTLCTHNLLQEASFCFLIGFRKWEWIGGGWRVRRVRSGYLLWWFHLSGFLQVDCIPLTKSTTSWSHSCSSRTAAPLSRLCLPSFPSSLMDDNDPSLLLYSTIFSFLLSLSTPLINWVSKSRYTVVQINKTLMNNRINSVFHVFTLYIYFAHPCTSCIKPSSNTSEIMPFIFCHDPSDTMNFSGHYSAHIICINLVSAKQHHLLH